MGNWERRTQKCRTAPCDRVAAEGLDYCIPCTIAFMEGQANAADGRMLRITARPVQLTPTLQQRMERIQQLAIESAAKGRVLLVRDTADAGIPRADITQLQEFGYILLTRRPGRSSGAGATSSVITILSPGRNLPGPSPKPAPS